MTGSVFMPLPEADFLKVVGESHYQPALSALSKACTGVSDGRPAFPATLIPEPENPHDSNALAVLGPTGQVGYLPRQTASRFATTFAMVHRAGYAGATCTGLLNGGGADRPTYGVVLRLAYPETCEDHVRALYGNA